MSSLPPSKPDVYCQQVAAWLAVSPSQPEEQRLLAVHLATCADCTARAARQSTLDALLRRHLIAAPPRDLSNRLAALAVAAARQQAQRRARPTSRWEERGAIYLGALLLVAVSWEGLASQWRWLIALGAELVELLGLALAGPAAAWLLPAALDGALRMGTVLIALLLFRLAITPARDLRSVRETRVRR